MSYYTTSISGNSSSFESENNVHLLFELIKQNVNNPVENIYNYIKSNQKTFIQTELLEKGHQSISLIEMNKKYLIYILTKLKNDTIHQTRQQPQLESYNPNPTPITYEEIKKEKIAAFDKKLESYTNDFNNAFDNTVPEMPNFLLTKNNNDADNFNFKENMETLIKQRNYESEQFIGQETNSSESLNVDKDKKSTQVKWVDQDQDQEQYQEQYQDQEFRNNSNAINKNSVISDDNITQLYDKVNQLESKINKLLKHFNID